MSRAAMVAHLARGWWRMVRERRSARWTVALMPFLLALVLVMDRPKAQIYIDPFIYAHF